VTWAQVKALGVDDAAVSGWLKQGYLHRVLPRVYAVGHPGSSTESDLAAALLYAGPGAMLSHATAAWWLGLLDQQPRQIHVSTPRQCRSQTGVTVHRRRACDRIWHEGLPVTTVSQTLLDLAAGGALRTVRRALAKADYAGTLDLQAVRAQLGAGRPGSATLRKALAEHEPSLARTKSGLEVLFLEICERAKIPPPEVNVRVVAGKSTRYGASSESLSSSTATAITAALPKSGATAAKSSPCAGSATPRCATPKSSSPSAVTKSSLICAAPGSEQASPGRETQPRSRASARFAAPYTPTSSIACSRDARARS